MEEILARYTEKRQARIVGQVKLGASLFTEVNDKIYENIGEHT